MLLVAMLLRHVSPMLLRHCRAIIIIFAAAAMP